MTHSTIHKLQSLLFTLLLVIFFVTFPSLSHVTTSRWIKHATRVTSSRFELKMAFASPGPRADPPKPVAFIISPSTQSGESEMLILQNFNQIQPGDKKKLGIIGTQDLTDNHRQMIELLSYALVLSGNHVFTSGGGNGTNCAVIKGALRACNPDLLSVILPQSLYKQPAEMQPLLARVANLIQQPEFDDLELKEAANICNERLIMNVDKVLVFAYHNSETILSAVERNKEDREVTCFYLD